MSDTLLLDPLLLIHTATTIFCIIIVVKLVQLYRRTSILDYLIFSGAFTCFMLYGNPIVRELSNYSILIVLQFRHFVLNLTHIFLLMHSLRISWKKAPRILAIIGWGWFFVLEILVFFWTPLASGRARVLFWELDPHPLSLPGSSAIGAGIAINDLVIYSTDHPLIAYCFYLYCATVFAFSYFYVKPVSPTTRIITALRVWKISSSINVTAVALLIVWPFPNTYIIASIMVFLEFFLAGIVVALKYPESMLTSYVQIIRAVNLYELIQKSTESELMEFSIDRITNYLASIPQELLYQDTDTRTG
ncbi:MAG: hypothetical protein ACFFD4_06425 [Candidatus Odinarchaeota archaeon]